MRSLTVKDTSQACSGIKGERIVLRHATTIEEWGIWQREAARRVSGYARLHTTLILVSALTLIALCASPWMGGTWIFTGALALEGLAFVVVLTASMGAANEELRASLAIRAGIALEHDERRRASNGTLLWHRALDTRRARRPIRPTP
jgi:hypothetical protein